jgi:hypothetical protein
VRTRLTSALVVAASVAAAPGGSAQTVVAAAPPGFRLTQRTAHGSYYARGAARPDVRRIEAFVGRLQLQLGAPASESRYFAYESPEEIAAATGHHAAGVTFGGRREVHSTQPFHRHELVHLVAAELGDPGRFFQEGLAVALGDEGRWQGAAVNALARRGARPGILKRLVADFDSAPHEVSYPVAGSFVAWLIKAHGLDRVRELFRTSGEPAAAFERAFGVSLDQAAAAWLASL